MLFCTVVPLYRVPAAGDGVTAGSWSQAERRRREPGGRRYPPLDDICWDDKRVWNTEIFFRVWGALVLWVEWG